MASHSTNKALSGKLDRMNFGSLLAGYSNGQGQTQRMGFFRRQIISANAEHVLWFDGALIYGC